MRLICPNCQQSVVVPDEAAGHSACCPACGKTFTPPALTGAAIDAAPPPTPVMKPEIRNPKSEARNSKSEPPAAPAAASAPASAPASDFGFRASDLPSPAGAACCRLTLRRDVAPWLAPAALVAVFIFTFFPWVGVAPNGTGVYVQNAWQAAKGSFSTDPVGDEVMKSKTVLEDNSSWSGLLTFYLILLVLAVLLAVAERVLVRTGARVPDAIRPVWPQRYAILAGLSGALLVLLALAQIFGFGLETAAAKAATLAAEQKLTPAAAAGGQPERPRAMLRDVELGRFCLHRSNIVALAQLMHLVALFGAGLSLWLDRHPDRPEPRIECYC